jgi:hypothetical protein
MVFSYKGNGYISPYLLYQFRITELNLSSPSPRKLDKLDKNWTLSNSVQKYWTAKSLINQGLPRSCPKHQNKIGHWKCLSDKALLDFVQKFEGFSKNHTSLYFTQLKK